MNLNRCQITCERMLTCARFWGYALRRERPWPLPGWRQRKRFMWRLLQCFGCVVGFPALSCNVSLIHVLITDALTSSCLLLWDLEYVCHVINRCDDACVRLASTATCSRVV